MFFCWRWNSFHGEKEKVFLGEESGKCEGDNKCFANHGFGNALLNKLSRLILSKSAERVNKH